MQYLKKIGFTALGILGIISLLCSIAAASITNQHLMKEGFLSYADTKHLDVTATEYEKYAKAIASYLDGQGEKIQVPSRADASLLQDAFSEKENLHMRDVRGIVALLKSMRWIGGGITLAILAALYLFGKENRSKLMNQAFEGFAYGSIAVLGVILGLGVWGLIDFDGLFWNFHQVAFSNDLWLLNPQTDLLVALMPLDFFTWYAGELLKSLLPVLGIMLCLIIAWFKVGRKEA
ncbi:MAG: TIGR01906 family membrane protein [Clostridiales bacterium]|nr:TIGR01906 family membrane protein [Clostridiales bacterium]